MTSIIFEIFVYAEEQGWSVLKFYIYVKYMTF